MSWSAVSFIICLSTGDGREHYTACADEFVRNAESNGSFWSGDGVVRVVGLRWLNESGEPVEGTSRRRFGDRTKPARRTVRTRGVESRWLVERTG